VVRNTIARIAVAVGGLFAAACGGQSGPIPGSGARGSAYATQAEALQRVALPAGDVRAQTQETVLHSFVDGSDGAYPMSDLTDLNGVLYGTTYQGGAANLGTVFSLSL